MVVFFFFFNSHASLLLCFGKAPGKVWEILGGDDVLGESLSSPLLLCLVPACLSVAGGILGKSRVRMLLYVVGQYILEAPWS